MTGKAIDIYSDGASRGNPGDASYGYVFVEDGEIVDKDSAYLGRKTNNQAEYHAVINALEHALEAGVTEVRFHSDSKLLVNQLNGDWRVKDAQLRKLYEQVQELREQFGSVTFTHHRREHNFIAEADRLCNETLDRNGK